MSGLLEEISAFKTLKASLEVDARQHAAFRLISGIDLPLALAAEPGEAVEIIRRVERLIERERLKGLRRHWAYDLNRHIALKQALEQLRKAHGHCERPLADVEVSPWNARRRQKAPSRKRTVAE
jgi:hypothetical protein